MYIITYERNFFLLKLSFSYVFKRFFWPKTIFLLLGQKKSF
ncbi:hypothetical protein B506_03038 [Lactobacillus delbrueckii subsp. jakobsenii ZN7a-9 = DSM 26046]|nr:hypothetical protein B506_03038 [Lactobacillus delbrueckii subsp. jakobsenii ZN7a-9 = DSM 26046]